MMVGIWNALGYSSGEPSPESWGSDHISAFQELGPHVNLIVDPAKNSSGNIEVMNWCLTNRKINIWSVGLEREIHWIGAEKTYLKHDVREEVRRSWRKLADWWPIITGVLINCERYAGSGTKDNPDFRQDLWVCSEFNRLNPSLQLAAEGGVSAYVKKGNETLYDQIFRFPRGVLDHVRYNFYGWDLSEYWLWRFTWGQIKDFRDIAKTMRYRQGSWVYTSQAFEANRAGVDPDYRYPSQTWQDFVCLNAIAHGAAGLQFWPFDTYDSSEWCGLRSTYNSSGAAEERIVVKNSIEKSRSLWEKLQGLKLVDWSLNLIYYEDEYTTENESAISLDWPLEKVECGDPSSYWNLVEICRWIMHSGFERYTLSPLDPRPGQAKTLQIHLKESCEWSIGSQSGYGKTISGVSIQPGQVEVLTLRRW